MRISVVTPTFNSEEFVRQCIGSVLMQKGGPGLEVEHVIADGGSTDRTVEIAESLGCSVFSEPDDGLFDATNKGTQRSTGQLVGFLGADDVLMPGALEAIARRYLVSDRRWITGSYEWVDRHFDSLGVVAAPPAWLTSDLLASLGWCYPLHMATYVERSLFDEIGGFDTSMPISADYRFFTEALRRAPFAREPRVIAMFRRHGENMSMSPYAEESAAVAEDYGPGEAWKRSLYGLAMKAWVNGRNPRWAARKLVLLRPQTKN